LGRDVTVEAIMQKSGSKETVKAPVPAIKDSGKIRLGFMSPSFPPVRVAPADVEDKKKVRLGFMSPSF
jgi:hypothetical protein